MFLSPNFISNLRTQMRVIQERPYAAFLNSKNAWWPFVAKVMPSQTEKQVVMWLLQTAQLTDTGLSTDVAMKDLSILKAEFTPNNISTGLKLNLNQFKDTDANGVNILAGWTQQVSEQAVYFPQKQIAAAIRAGETTTGYDGVNFFSIAHPYNPANAKNTATYANLLTSTASSTPLTDPSDALYPGAVDISTAVSFEVAFYNLQKVFSYIFSLRQANGDDPRFLRPRAILASSALHPRVNGLLGAKFAAFSAATSGTAGGSTDIEGQLQSLGFVEAYLCPEFDSDPTTFYVIVEQIASTELGALIWLEREPVGIQTYFPTDGDNSELAIRNEMMAIARGRAAAVNGHPYLIFKCKAS